MILNDKQIKKLAEEEDMINPFVKESIAQGISHGLNSFGFDLRCGDEFKIFTNIKGAIADPKNFTEDNFVTIDILYQIGLYIFVFNCIFGVCKNTKVFLKDFS